jgi:hypothetical protein
MIAQDRQRLLAVAALIYIIVVETAAAAQVHVPRHPAERPKSAPPAVENVDPSVWLQNELSANGVGGAAELASVLCDLGLRSISDVSHLSTPDEQAELAVSLRGSGISLGERNRLRRAAVKFGHGFTGEQYQPPQTAEEVSRRLQEEEAKKDNSLSRDTITVRQPHANAHQQPAMMVG